MVPKNVDDDEDDVPRTPPKKGGPPKTPFDDLFRGFGIDPGEFDKMFDQMNRAMQEAMKNLGGLEPGKPYMHGFSFKIGPDGKPIVQEFGNRPQKPVKGAKPVISDEREPVTDVIEERNQIAVTLEMPGIDKKDIDIRVTESELEINVDTPKRKYHKLLKLPTQVKPTTTKATYKNGVLDVTVDKERPAPAAGKGHRVSVE